MESIKASSKGQIVIPKPIREALDIRSGTELSMELEPGRGFRVTLKPSNRAELVRRLAGSLAHRGARMTPAQEEAALLQAVKADDERTKSGRRRRG